MVGQVERQEKHELPYTTGKSGDEYFYYTIIVLLFFVLFILLFFTLHGFLCSF